MNKYIHLINLLIWNLWLLFTDRNETKKQQILTFNKKCSNQLFDDWTVVESFGSANRSDRSSAAAKTDNKSGLHGNVLAFGVELNGSGPRRPLTSAVALRLNVERLDPGRPTSHNMRK